MRVQLFWMLSWPGGRKVDRAPWPTAARVVVGIHLLQRGVAGDITQDVCSIMDRPAAHLRGIMGYSEAPSMPNDSDNMGLAL
ncbi:hypothetical protein N7537_011902 [Penicillium hordei]|uniref:Uncharacterized protein n=1 Tax=Penicillium hordei TaxID=40994 RepID=A0AAD6DP50_9EURO|nr:uncharacterized protein N7537_011902 [Penicillium hordei]KAJ5589224.1 hypothetical protein N7537_011902 [Penicillium hordei]